MTGFTFIRQSDSLLEKMKNFRVIHREEEYDLYYNNGSFLLLDVIGLVLFRIKTRRNLVDKAVMEDLVKIYEYQKYTYSL